MYRVDGLIPKDTCKYFIDFYNQNKNENVIDKEISYKHKTNTFETDNFHSMNLSFLSLKDDKYKKPLDVAKRYLSIMITNYVMHIKKNICPTFNMDYVTQSENIRILKYKKGEFIGDHSDVADTIRASCTLNLNEDYEGGEFRFFDGREKLSFKTGDALFFPAEPIWVHGTEPIKNGTRYSINCFLFPKN
jgi:hypothetical protein|tara:strand:- start:2432 stop:3001 length:570 start_codon:yes stop_codon:yes gene_type:complete